VVKEAVCAYIPRPENDEKWTSDRPLNTVATYTQQVNRTKIDYTGAELSAKNKKRIPNKPNTKFARNSLNTSRK
jgi:hypothetical protein